MTQPGGSDSPRRSEQPHDPATELAGAMLDCAPIEGRAIALVYLPNGQAGIALRGYEHDTEAVADILVHLQAIMRANGKDLAVVAAGGQG